MKNPLQLLMVFGQPGQDGLNAAKHVVEENQQEQGHAVVKHVEENLALETTVKRNVAMRNVAVNIFCVLQKRFKKISLAV